MTNSPVLVAAFPLTSAAGDPALALAIYRAQYSTPAAFFPLTLAALKTE